MFEDFINNCYIPENIKRIKIDVGLSYGAPFSQNWLEKEEDLFVFGFEPNPESVLNILENDVIEKQNPLHPDSISSKNKNRFFLFPFALSFLQENEEENGLMLDFYMTKRDCGTSSLFRPTDTVLYEVKKIVKVPIFSLSRFLKLFFEKWGERFSHIEYLKIDAQGSDYNILLGAKEFINRIAVITAEPEYNGYDGCNNNTFENINNYLKSVGFENTNEYPTMDPTFINKDFLHLKDKLYIFQKI
jgi:hypothetical protein